MASDSRTEADLRAENEILRERLDRFEHGSLELVDPVMRALVDHVPAFLNVISPEGRFIATGRTSEGFGSVIGRSVFEFTEPANHDAMKAAYARVCATKQATTYETVGYSEVGEPGHTYVVRAVPLVEPADVRVHVPRREYLRDLQILRIAQCTERLPRSASAGGHLPMALERIVCHVAHDVVPGNAVHVADEQRAQIVGEFVVQLLPR